jgi:transposase-like protein
MTEKKAEKDPALKMAKAIGNVSEACRRGGMDRTSFYEWKRRFQTHGISGLLAAAHSKTSTQRHATRTRSKSSGSESGASNLGLRKVV